MSKEQIDLQLNLEIQKLNTYEAHYLSGLVQERIFNEELLYAPFQICQS